MPRNRAFDEGVLLDQAIELFWVHGYRGVSIHDISAATGVGNGSIYLAFGSKQDLFLAAFSRYCERRVRSIRSSVDAPAGSVPEVLEQFFEFIISDCLASPERRGCFLVNSIVEMSEADDVVRIASASTGQMEDALTLALGRVDPSKPHGVLSSAAAQAVALSQALILSSRLRATREELRRLAATGRDTIAQVLLAA